MNDQQVEKKVNSALLDLHSMFLTFQGEGIFAGRPAIFIRLAGCNLQCPLCDTDYTRGRQLRSVDSVAEEAVGMAERWDLPLFVITGGEPFRQPIALHALVLALLDYGLVQIETNGTLWHPCVSAFDDAPGFFIVVSPKTGSVHKEIAARADAWKYVARACELDELDGLPLRALDHPAAPRLFRPPDGERRIFLQPADEYDAAANEKNQKAVLASCLAHGYTFCMQLHKIVGVP